MAVDSKAFQQPMVSTGTNTSASSAVDITETLGYSPSWVIVVTNAMSGQTPDIHIASAADAILALRLQGSDGVTEMIAIATAIDITATGFIIRSERQTNSAVNWWIAFR